MSDGSICIENQALEPVENVIEMHDNWDNVTTKLRNHPEYPALFKKAFQEDGITKELASKALAQFERTLISDNSKFDKFLLGEVSLTNNEMDGFDIFMNESKGDCFHCHGSDNNPIWADNKFHNNGLNLSPTDIGLQFVTGNASDKGKFKTPSLRNLEFTGPYMHDGRFETIEDVINHYSEGLFFCPSPVTIHYDGYMLW